MLSIASQCLDFTGPKCSDEKRERLWAAACKRTSCPVLAWYCGMPEKTPALRGHGKKAGCLLTSPLFATVSLSLVVVIFGEQNLRIFVLG